MKLAENFPTSDTVQSGGAENSLLALCFNFKNYTGRREGGQTMKPFAGV